MSEFRRRVSLGVLFTGFVERSKTPLFRSTFWKKRYLVLTHAALHEFKREEINPLFGEMKHVHSFETMVDLQFSEEDGHDNRAFRFKDSTTGLTHHFRANDIKACEEWQEAITDAHEDFKKEQTLRRENRKRRSVSVRRRQTVSGDYRTERSRWPDLQRLGFGDSKGNEGIPQVSKTQDGVAWGETVKLGTHPGLCDTDVNTIFATFQMDQDRYIVVDSETLRKPLLDLKTEGSTHHQFVIDDDGDELLESVFEEVVPVLTSDGKPTKKHQMRLAIKARVEPHINMGLSCQRLQCLSWASSTAVLLSLALFLLSYSLDSTFFLPSLRIGFILAFIAQVFSVLALRTAHRLYITPLLWEQDRSPTDEVAMNMPQRFVKAEKGNHAKGLARYKSTLAWRKENDIETILTRPHLKFNLIKKYYPHAYHKRDKYGHPVYFEQPGRINLPILAENDITVSDLLYHCIFSSEYLWKMIEPDEENGKVFSVLDIEGIGLKDVGGAVTDFIKGASSVTGAHYPERSFKIFIINAPSWFSFAWRIISPMIDKTTRSKISILSADYQEALLEHIDADNLPVEYGGTCSCSRHDCSNGSVTEGVSGMSLPPPPSDEFRRAGEDGFIPVPCFLYSPEERDLKELAERANNKAE